MKPEYDFSKAERGKFFRPNAALRLPIYLDSDVQSYLVERAAQKGISLGEMVNGLLKQEIQIIESVKG
jgi:predicted HicB family RNase H-like nuclease